MTHTFIRIQVIGSRGRMVLSATAPKVKFTAARVVTAKE